MGSRFASVGFLSYLHPPMAPGCSSAWLERLLWEQEVAGSNPVTPTLQDILHRPRP
jgi:hypothetical protein